MNAAPFVHFAVLDHAQQLEAIRKLAAGGAGDHEIARLTGMHVEQIRKALSDRSDKREVTV